MYSFSDKFLETVGLSSLPEEQKAGFLEYAQDQFEVRIGEKMSENLTDEQLEEFDKIADNDAETINRYLSNAGDYKNDAIYKALLANGGEDGSVDTINNYVTVTWLNKNCPDYAKMLEEVLADFENEVRSQKDAILASV